MPAQPASVLALIPTQLGDQPGDARRDDDAERGELALQDNRAAASEAKANPLTA